MEIEIWKPVPRFAGIFEVSNLGRLRSVERRVANGRGTRIVRSRILKVFSNGAGYLGTVYKLDGHCVRLVVHRAVAEAFLPQDAARPHVNHLDGNRGNNRTTNLEWCTPSENMQHARRYLPRRETRHLKAA